MMKRRRIVGLSLSTVLGAGAVLAISGNLNSCTDLPEVVYMNTSAKTVGIYIANDTPAHNISWALTFGPLVQWSNTCAGGYVTYAAEVASHGCSTSSSVSGSTLNVSIGSCTTPLPTRMSHEKIFNACYLPTSAMVPPGDASLAGSCTASNNSSGAMACEFGGADTVVTHAFHATTIPPSFDLNGGQVYTADLRVGTLVELNSTSATIATSNDTIQFLDTSNAACCAALTGSSTGCPHAGANIKQVLPAQTLPGDCSIEQHWNTVGDSFYAKVTCTSGMDFLSTVPEALLKFCYYGTEVGDAQISDDCVAIKQSGGPSPYVCYATPRTVYVD